jgi:hypothetical protein
MLIFICDVYFLIDYSFCLFLLYAESLRKMVSTCW